MAYLFLALSFWALLSVGTGLGKLWQEQGTFNARFKTLQWSMLIMAMAALLLGFA